MSDPTLAVIEQFGKDDYERLVEMGSEDVQNIGEITCEELTTITALLRKLIKARRLFFMDKENGVAFRAVALVGFEGDSILVVNDR
jgi:hypothetical protein